MFRKGRLSDQEIADFIRYRRKLGISQYEAAEQANISRSIIANMERKAPTRPSRKNSEILRDLLYQWRSIEGVQDDPITSMQAKPVFVATIRCATCGAHVPGPEQCKACLNCGSPFHVPPAAPPQQG